MDGRRVPHRDALATLDRAPARDRQGQTGKVIIGGSESHGVSDLEVYVPWYIACGAPRPVIQTVDGVNVITPGYTAPVLTVNQSFFITSPVPTGAAISKVVLIRALASDLCPEARGQRPGSLLPCFLRSWLPSSSVLPASLA